MHLLTTREKKSFPYHTMTNLFVFHSKPAPQVMPPSHSHTNDNSYRDHNNTIGQINFPVTKIPPSFFAPVEAIDFFTCIALNTWWNITCAHIHCLVSINNQHALISINGYNSFPHKRIQWYTLIFHMQHFARLPLRCSL